MITFYDIDSKTKESWSPNTLKTKLALAHKGLNKGDYKAEWISYPDIAPLLKSKGVQPAAGPPTSQYTLPAIEHDGKAIMDSWAVAEYLEASFPDTAPLFPHGSKPLARIVWKLAMADISYKLFPILLPKLTDFLDPNGGEYFRRTREEVYGPYSHDICNDHEYIASCWKQVEQPASVLAQALEDNQGGPFFLGEQRSYADIELVSILEWYRLVHTELYDGMVERHPCFKTLYEACADILHQ